MKAVYFAWVRERIGKSEEQVSPPPEGAERRWILSPSCRNVATATPTRLKGGSDPCGN